MLNEIPSVVGEGEYFGRLDVFCRADRRFESQNPTAKGHEMADWEYATIVMGTPDNKGRRWMFTSPDPNTPGAQVGAAEKPRFIGRLWQGTRLFETALKEMDDRGWELVSHSFSGLIFAFYGIAVFRRPAGYNQKQTP
ncbi:MAG: hypothetical protein WEB58_10630 [Planctomycetaceae bacterium]